jgi:hypothetical protein
MRATPSARRGFHVQSRKTPDRATIARTVARQAGMPPEQEAFVRAVIARAVIAALATRGYPRTPGAQHPGSFGFGPQNGNQSFRLCQPRSRACHLAESSEIS